MEVSLPHPGDFQVLDGTEQGEEIPGVVTVPFGGMLFQIELPFLQYEPLQEVFDQALELRKDPL